METIDLPPPPFIKLALFLLAGFYQLPEVVDYNTLRAVVNV